MLIWNDSRKKCRQVSRSTFFCPSTAKTIQELAENLKALMAKNASLHVKFENPRASLQSKFNENEMEPITTFFRKIAVAYNYQKHMIIWWKGNERSDWWLNSPYRALQMRWTLMKWSITSAIIVKVREWKAWSTLCITLICMRNVETNLQWRNIVKRRSMYQLSSGSINNWTLLKRVVLRSSLKVGWYWHQPWNWMMWGKREESFGNYFARFNA